MLLKFNTEKEWLEGRKQDVTSTDVSALFGLHPYKSRLRLWMEKAGELESDFVENNFTKWGRRLQIPVGMGICEDEGWDGYDLTGYYYRDPILRSGASLDIKAVCRDHGVGNLEVKIAESFDEDMGWFKDKAPMMYEFQVQSQLHEAAKNGTPFDWAAIAAFGKRQTTRIYFRTYDKDLGALIDEELRIFWASIAANEPPPADYAVDGPLLERLARPVRLGEAVNLSLDNRAMELVSQYEAYEKDAKLLRQGLDSVTKEKDAIKAEIHEKMGNAETAIIGNFQVGGRQQIVEDRFNPAYSYRRFDFKRLKKGT